MDFFEDYSSNIESSLIFVDSSVGDYQKLVSEVDDAEVIVLDNNRNGIEQITAELENRRHLENIHLVSHGDDGLLQLGNTQLTLQNIGDYSQDIQGWSQALTENADIFLYGCNVVKTTVGETLVRQLSELTQADLAASNDSTGSQSLGGDWDLEMTIGDIKVSFPFAKSAIANYNSLLATYNDTEYQLTSTAKTWQDAQAEAVALGGNLVTVNDIIEQGWLVNTFGNTEAFWIGLNDRDNEGEFVWASGERVTYTNWLPGQPDNDNEGEDYAVINGSNDTGQWNDASNDALFRGIIEIPETPANPGVVQLESSNLTINEGDSTIEVTVLLGNGSSNPVTVDYQTIDAEAIAGADYSNVSGTLTFAPGETSKTIAIAINDDNRVEPNENFSLNLENVAGASLGELQTTRITIEDNDSGEEPPVLDGASFNFSNFNNISELYLNGNADRSGNVLRVAPAESVAVGSIFYNDAIALSDETSFQTQFQFQIGGGAGSSGSSGFTFMLQNDSDELTAIGTTGYGMGYRNIDNSLAIEFDNYDSGSFDPNNNHVSILRDGRIDRPLATAVSDFDLNGDVILNAWVDYNGETDELEVYLSDTEAKPANPIVAENVELAEIVGDRALVGFSAASGYDPIMNNHDLRNWKFNSSDGFVTPPQTPSQDLLPDLSIIESTLDEDRYIDTSSQPGRVLLRLATEVANTGDGPLEIWGGEPEGDTQPVYQRIYQEDSSSPQDRLAGDFVFYESHGHVHFEDFASYNLREINTDGSIGEIVGSGSKMSFCLINLRHPYPELTESAVRADGRGGNACDMIQGISVGYSDVYSSNLPGQSIDITGIPDGEYWLEVVADPNNKIQELDEENNVGGIAIAISNPQQSSVSSTFVAA